MQKRFFYTIFTFVAVCFASCGEEGRTYEAIETTAIDFANAYFNYDLVKAQTMVDDKSKKWLRYEASNITEADLELLRMQDEGATVTVDDCECFEDSAVVTVTVNFFFLVFFLCSKGRMVEEKTFTIVLLQDGSKKWKVRMEGPLRSGM